MARKRVRDIEKVYSIPKFAAKLRRLADALEANGLMLPELSDELRAQIAARLPAEASTRNPVDLIASGDPEDRAKFMTLFNTNVQFAEVAIARRTPENVVEFRYRGGTDVYVTTVAPETGARSGGVRILRSRADARALRVLLEGRNGHTYDLFLRTTRQPAAVRGATLVREGGGDPILRVSFDGAGLEYTRREVVVKEVTVPATEPFVPDAARIEALGITPRELEVLQLIAEGLSTKEMADRLFVSENTVKTHTGRVLEKLGASRRTQAVQLAKNQRIIA